MKRINYLLLLLSLIGGSVFGQKVALKVDLDERDEVYYEKNSSKPFTGVIEDMTENTNDYMRVQVVDGVADGFFEGYYDPGRTHIKWRATFVKGKKQGAYVYYYEDGTIGFVANMKNDELHGRRLCYHESGKLWHVHYYRKGKEVSQRKEYDKSGNLDALISFRAGKKNGRYVGFHDDGKTRINGKYKDGKRSGVWKEYNSSGKRVARVRYNTKTSPSDDHIAD